MYGCTKFNANPSYFNEVGTAVAQSEGAWGFGWLKPLQIRVWKMYLAAV